MHLFPSDLLKKQCVIDAIRSVKRLEIDTGTLLCDTNLLDEVITIWKGVCSNSVPLDSTVLILGDDDCLSRLPALPMQSIIDFSKLSKSLKVKLTLTGHNVTLTSDADGPATWENIMDDISSTEIGTLSEFELKIQLYAFMC